MCTQSYSILPVVVESVYVESPSVNNHHVLFDQTLSHKASIIHRPSLKTRPPFVNSLMLGTLLAWVLQANSRGSF